VSRLKLAIWAALFFASVYFVYVQYQDGAALLAIGPVLLSLGMICWQWRESVTRATLRQGLTVAFWGLVASSLAVSLYFNVVLSRSH
jgi:hypothetical protein